MDAPPIVYEVNNNILKMKFSFCRGFFPPRKFTLDQAVGHEKMMMMLRGEKKMMMIKVTAL